MTLAQLKTCTFIIWLGYRKSDFFFFLSVHLILVVLFLHPLTCVYSLMWKGDFSEFLSLFCTPNVFTRSLSLELLSSLIGLPFKGLWCDYRSVIGFIDASQCVHSHVSPKAWKTTELINSFHSNSLGCTKDSWIAPLPHSRKVVGSSPVGRGVFLFQLACYPHVCLDLFPG